jgi:predicted nucleotidyltransferase component of viral defense system
MAKINIINQPPEERILYFQKAAEIGNKSAHIIEKDYWVCWLLEKLFSIKKVNEHLTFKGGTSLSKVYGVIERFSEDIDISIERAFLGFTGDKDPEKMGSKKRNETLKELSEACRKYIDIDLKGLLEKAIKTELAGNWSLSIDPDDPDQQTLLFHYPRLLKENSQYVRPIVKIELGARSEHWPVSQQQISSYLKQALADTIEENPIQIKALNVERTFWEKATILHMYAHLQDGKVVPERQSRHYYDFYCLLKSEFKTKSAKEVSLLERVAEHKSIYFRAGWASYETARKGTLRLIPSSTVLEQMERDYVLMNEMFFIKPPLWAEIAQVIKAFESEFNQK